jgi:hypothetical protein
MEHCVASMLGSLSREGSDHTSSSAADTVVQRAISSITATNGKNSLVLTEWGIVTLLTGEYKKIIKKERKNGNIYYQFSSAG